MMWRKKMADIKAGFYWGKLKRASRGRGTEWDMIIKVSGVEPFYTLAGWDLSMGEGGTRIENISMFKTPIIFGPRIEQPVEEAEVDTGDVEF
jgi:hypothetical protein